MNLGSWYIVVLMICSPWSNFSEAYEVTGSAIVILNQPAKFVLKNDMLDESDILCLWNFGDGSDRNLSAMDMGSPVIHIFNETGLHSVQISCTTGEGWDNKSIAIEVKPPLEWLSCEVTDEDGNVPPVFSMGEGSLLFHYNHTLEDDVSYRIYLDGQDLPVTNSVTTMDGDTMAGHLIMSQETQASIGPGKTEFTLLVYGDSHGAQCTMNADLQEAIVNLTTRTLDSFVAANMTFDLTVEVDAGDPLNLNMSVWKDGQVVLEPVFAGNLTAWGGFTATVPMAFTETGVYTIITCGWNDVSLLNYQWNITVQNKLLGVQADAPDPILYVGDPVFVNITFDLEPSLPAATDLSLEFTMGDGQQIVVPHWGHNHVDYAEARTIEVTYTDQGIYSSTLRLYNGVSDKSVTIQVMILEPIAGVNITSYSELPSISEGAEVLPVEYPVHFVCSLGEGTIQWVTWEVAGQNVTNITATCDWQFTFPSFGTYTVTAVVGNDFSQGNGTTHITLVESVTELMLVNNGPVLLEEDITFVLFAGTFGTNSTFSVNFGDGQSYEFVEFSKNSSMKEFLKPGLLLPFEPTQQYSRIIKHHYLIDGSYLAIAYGWNMVSSLVAFSEVKVNLKPCDIPELHIRSGSPDFSSATEFHRNHAITLHADMTIDCQGSDETLYRWRVYRIDDVFPYPGIFNEVLFGETVRTDLVECYIPPFTLAYGDYIVEISVTTIMNVDDSLGMIEYDQSYIKVVPNLLVPRITGGSRRFISWYSDVLLDGSASYDPDLPLGDTQDPDLIFRWFCRHANETFPEAFNDSLETSGGCFNSGFLVTSDSSPAVSASSSLKIPAQALEGNNTYTFVLEISKADRDPVTTEQTITILPGNVTDVLIRCVINCDMYLNPSERLVLSGKCGDCPESTSPSYEWAVTPDSGNTSMGVVDWGQDTTTGRNKAYLVIKGGVFSRYNIPKYTLRLTIHSASGSSSHAEYTIMINFPPTRGTCFVAPTEGFVLFTYFYISCSMFFDVDTPLGYQIRVLTDHTASGSHLEDYSQGSLLFFGLDPLFPPTMLPLGSPSNDYAINIAIIATDAFGASVIAHLNATVRPPQQTSEEVFYKLVNLTQGEDSEMTHLLESGDTQAATQLITTVSSILNSETERELMDGEDNGAKKEARVQVRDHLINNLNLVEIHDMDSVQLTSTAVAEATKEKAEISTTAQISASDIYHRMGSILQEQSNGGATSVAIEGTARQLVAGVANVMGAASQLRTNTTGVEDGAIALDNSTAGNSRHISLTSVDALKKIETAILHNKVPGEESFVIQTEEVDLLLNRLEKWEIDGKLFEVPGRETFIKLPSNFQDALRLNGSLSGHAAILDTHVRHFTDNPYSWSGDSGITSQVTAIDIIGDQTSTMDATNLPEDVHIFLDNSIDEQSVTLAGQLDNTTGQKMFGFNVSDEFTHIVIHFELENNFVQENTTSINVTIRDEINSTEASVWFSFSLPEEMLPFVERSRTSNVTGDPFSILLERDVFGEEGSYYMDIELEGTRNWTYEWNLTVLVYSPSCVYWDEVSEMWKADGCQPGPLTNLKHIHCICNHLSTFAGGFVPLPNAINLRADILLFSELFENPVTAVTVLCILLIFSLCAYWARKKDMREKKLEVIYLADNDPDAFYEYHVTIITGMRRSSGTSSTATLTLNGTRGSSDPHVLTAPHRAVLQRGNKDSFIIATHQSLGDLISVRLWHDNGGKSPDWYISRIIVHDLQNKGWWYFLCQSWLGLGFGENCIDKTFPVATKEDLTEFHHLFLAGMQRDINEYHLWVSVVVRPPQSAFTRLQRAACCLCITLTAMLASIIFYGVPEEYTTQDSNISFGSLTLSWSSVIIGVESSIVTVPINYFICQLFRNARRRPHNLVPRALSDISLSTSTFQTASSNSAESKNTERGVWRYISIGGVIGTMGSLWTRVISPLKMFGNSVAEHNSHKGTYEDIGTHKDGSLEGAHHIPYRRRRHVGFSGKSFIPRDWSSRTDQHGSKFGTAALGEGVKRTASYTSAYETPAGSLEELIYQWRQEGYKAEQSEDSDIEKYEEFHGCLPWWSIYIAWALVFLTCLVCSFFIILYGLRYGKQQSLDWLVSMLVSLFQSIAITQPINVVIFAALFAILLPTHTHDVIGLGTSRVVDARAEISSGGNLDVPLHQLKTTHYYRPPTTRRIEKAREKRLEKAQMYSVLKAFLGQVAFIFLVLEMAYMGRDKNTFLMKQALMNSFAVDVDEVRTSEDLLDWMKTVFVPALYGGVDGFIAEDFAFRIGGARMRQSRTKYAICKPLPLVGISSCEEVLDTASYNTSWTLATTEEHDPGSPWMFQSARVLKGSRPNTLSSGQSSRGGGYALYLGVSFQDTLDQIDYIEEVFWLDSRTRAIFVEWNLMNPNTNLLCICCILFERLKTGEFRATPEFDIMKPLDLQTFYDKFSLGLHSIYLVIILILIYIEVQKYQKNRSGYWGFWNVLTILIILLSIGATVAFSLWLLRLGEAMHCYRQDPEGFCSFFEAALANRIFNYLIAAIVFFSSLKCAKILRYNKSVHLMQMTWQTLARKFKMSLMVILVVFLAFSVLAYLLFGTSIYYFSSLVSSFETLFFLVSGSFDQLTEITQSYQVISMVFVLLTLFVLLYIFMNLMIVFIIESFREAGVRCEAEVDHRDVVSSLIGWVSSYLGIKTKKEDEEEQDDYLVRGKYNETSL